MKKITALLSVVLFTVAAQAQTVNFKVEYKPNTTYTSTTSQDNKIEIGYGGEPMVQEMKSELVNTLVVGSLTNGEAPFTMELSMDKNTQGAEQLNGTKITGKVKPGQMPVIEAVKTPGNEPMMNDMMKGMIEQTMKQAFFQPRQIKVGESFVQESPLEIPMGHVTMKMKDVVTYKLLKVEGTKAHFSQDHVITLDMDVEGQNMKGTGTGKGTMIYDMTNNFVINNVNDVVMDMGFEAQGQAMNIKSSGIVTMNVVIAPTK
jgi:hypothetical protein